MGIDKLLLNKGYEAAFPLHDGPPEPNGDDHHGTTQILQRYWARMGMWYKDQPLDMIRGYFGEKMGLQIDCE